MNILLDCANGAASAIAPEVFRRAGCNVSHIHSSPDGLNINKDCGSTHINSLAEHVKKGGFDVGFAYDGDADRLIAVSERGEVIDGDVLMSVLTLYLRAKDCCTKTPDSYRMSIWYYRFRQEQLHRDYKDKVGDRYVVEEMRKGGYSIGGEQSGHIVLLPYHNGDGILASLKIAEILAENNIKASSSSKL